MNKKIESMVINMVVGKTDGSATEEEWAEIISQISISEN